MKNKILLIIIFLVIIVFLFIIFPTDDRLLTIIFGENLVQNSGFENSLNTEPAFWYKSGADYNHLLIWDNISHSGTKSLKMEVLSSTKSWYNWKGENINVEPNTWYSVEYWYKTENLPAQDTLIDVYANGPNASYTNAPARAMFEWSEFNETGPNRYKTSALLINWTEGNTGWNKKSAYFKTGPSTIYINPRFFFYTYSGKVWFDDLVIKKATELGVENITFEDYYWSGIKGVGIHGGHYNDVAGMKELGVTMIRDDITWQSVEKTKGTYIFTTYDTRVDQLLAVGIEPLEILDYSNCLYNSMPSGQNYSCDRYIPRDPVEFEVFKKAYGEFCYQTVNHFEGKVKYFEMWNEPNGFWQPRTDDEVQALQYIELMKECYTRAKQANSNSIILSAGIGTWDSMIKNYIENYYKQSAKNYFDILAIHPYCNYNSGFPSTEQGKTCGTIENIAKIRDIMVANGDSNKEIWITEFGYPTEGCGFSGPTPTKSTVTFSCPTNLNEVNQEIRIRNIIPTLREKYPYVTAFFWYDYKDDCSMTGSRRYDIIGCVSRTIISLPDCPMDYECRFGLVRNDLSRKPAYYTYQNLSKYQCTSDKCDGTIYYACLNNKFISRGEIVGKCGVLSPSGDDNQTILEVPINKLIYIWIIMGVLAIILTIIIYFILKKKSEDRLII